MLPCPGLAGGGELLLLAQPLRLQGGRPLVLAAGGRRLLLPLQAGDLLPHLAQVGGHGLGLDDVLGGRLVHQVDGLVGEEAVGDVAVGEAGRRLQGLIGDLYLVVGLVAGPQGLEHLDGLLHRGLLHVDGGEAALQGGVFLYVLAVVVQGGGADAAQLAPGQGGLHHGRGVYGALGGAGPHHLVDLIDEDDHLALGLLDLVQDGLEPLLELAAELGAGHHGGHVQGQEPLPLEVLGDVAADHPLGQPLHDGGLAHARLADEDGVVLGAAVEDLHHPLYLLLPADDGVQLPLAGQLRQVGGVALQGLVAGLRPGGVDAVAAADVGQGAVDLLAVDAELAQNAPGLAFPLIGHGDEEVVHADVLVLEAPGLGVGRLQQPDDAGRHVELARLVAQPGGAGEGLGHPLSEGLQVHAQLAEHLLGQVAVVGEHGHEDVLHVPLGVTLPAHQLLAGGQHLLGLLRESVLPHHTCLSPLRSVGSATALQVAQVAPPGEGHQGHGSQGVEG
ncbi:hypothetical protein HRbin25_00955 [bacterium HR25]|nr:hypothetical protein HRbin25_00955 [bacterium HR25]